MRKSVSNAPSPQPAAKEPTTPLEEPLSVQPAKRMERCKVCDRLSIGAHYGAAVCAFFRRTIGNGRSYHCTCHMPFRNKKKGCRHCRFMNCLKAGMDANVVQAIKPFPQSNDTLLSQLLSCRNRLYVCRGLLLREMDAQRMENAKWHMPDCCRGRTFECLSNVECRGLTQYWTDFLRCVPHFRECASPTLLTNHFVAIWIKLEQVLATASRGRIHEELCLSDYETTVPVTYDWFSALYNRHAMLFVSDPTSLAMLNLENASQLLHISRAVRRASLEDLEVTAMTQFLVAYYEREMFVDDASLKKFLDQVLRELHDHYTSTYRNYHERLGTITSILGEFHRTISLDKQFFMQMSLYTKSGQGMRLPSQSEPVNALHDLRRAVKM